MSPIGKGGNVGRSEVPVEVPVVHELLAAKALYLQAAHLRRSSLPFHPEMAVLLLQDAVELAAFFTAKSVGAKIDDHTRFEQYWKAVDDAQAAVAGAKALPLPTDMAKLNKARVAFKHHGNRPNVAQAAEHEDYAHQFLVRVARDFFGVDFDSLSEIDLIASAGIRDLLKVAEAHVAADECQKALQRCRDALDAAREIIRPFMQWDRSLKIPTGPREMQPISDAFAALGKAVIMVEFYLEAILLGLHPAERSLLEAFLPISHGHGRYLHRGPDAKPEIAAKCVEAVTRFAIAAERFADNAALEGWGFPNAGAARVAADAKQRGGMSTYIVDKPEKPGE